MKDRNASNCAQTTRRLPVRAEFARKPHDTLMIGLGEKEEGVGLKRDRTHNKQSERLDSIINSIWFFIFFKN